MIVNTNHNIILMDVDETLVSFSIAGRENQCIKISYGEYSEYVFPIQEHINFIKASKVRGMFVRVHSQSGSQWCEAVVKALGLEAYVDSCETKPKIYVDDLKADAWMSRLYLIKESDR